MRGCLKRTQGMTQKDLLELKKNGFTFWKRGNSQHENIPINKSCIETLVQSFWDLSSKDISIYLLFWRGDVSKGQKGWLTRTHFDQTEQFVFTFSERGFTARKHTYKIHLWNFPTELLRSLQQNFLHFAIDSLSISAPFLRAAEHNLRNTESDVSVLNI